MGAKFLGHSIGLVMDEAPALAKGFKEVLEPGMTFAVRTENRAPGARHGGRKTPMSSQKRAHALHRGSRIL